MLIPRLPRDLWPQRKPSKSYTINLLFHLMYSNEMHIFNQFSTTVSLTEYCLLGFERYKHSQGLRTYSSCISWGLIFPNSKEMAYDDPCHLIIYFHFFLKEKNSFLLCVVASSGFITMLYISNKKMYGQFLP